jgi:4-aminobutyrate aminotransferase-like enzyme
VTRDPFALPTLITAVPGPRSADLARRLANVESPNITAFAPHPPIFWADAWNANVADVDGNVYIDLTAGFGVAFAGHSNPAVTDAIARQSRRLAHGLGDVHPPEIKVTLLEKLAAISPGDLSVSILGSDGADAVEAALKTALLHTGRAGVIAFEGAYHGLTYGALAATWRDDFRSPFKAQLNRHVRFAPFPSGPPDAEAGSLEKSLDAVKQAMREADEEGCPIGAIIVEPIQGRGGIVVPPQGFLPALRDLCDGRTTVLIFDEIYTGMGRTGRWFASEWSGVVPDIMTVGKALTGSIALSAAIGTPAVMAAWPPSSGEAIHTSTFLGNPTACAAALAQISSIEEGDLAGRAVWLGERIAARSRLWVTKGLAVARRGAGLLQGVRLHTAELATDVMANALTEGVIVLPEGDGSVLSITPPACIHEQQLDHALDVIERLLRRA